jgi:hypothetical protein
MGRSHRYGVFACAAAANPNNIQTMEVQFPAGSNGMFTYVPKQVPYSEHSRPFEMVASGDYGRKSSDQILVFGDSLGYDGVKLLVLDRIKAVFDVDAHNVQWLTAASRLGAKFRHKRAVFAIGGWFVLCVGCKCGRE